jgi:glycosyltransferase involved in cell wall biosynthesis
MVVGHGIDTELFSPKNIPHPPSMVSIGRFSPSKKLELLIDVMKSVRSRMPDALGRIVGDAATPENEAYAVRTKVYAEAAGVAVEKPVTHAGVPAVLHLSDIFLNASMTSSIDKAVLEAMACGVVPVTSNVAFREMFLPWNLFVDPTAESFADRTVGLLENGEERKRLSAAVREEVVNKHSLARLIRLLAETYHSL